MIPTPLAVPTPLPPPAGRPERPRILVVDDEPQALRVFSAFLSASGMEVFAVPSGSQAVELLEPGRFETIVSDLRMPGLDGFAFLRVARERDADLPVVVVTGCPIPVTPADAFDLGAFDYLIKPVSADTLVRTVTTSARLCRLARSVRRASSLGTDVEDPTHGPSVAAAFARALRTLYLAWQPIVRPGDGCAWGREAFARTLEPSLSAPSALFGAADRLDLHRSLGRALRRAAAEESAWLDGETVFVNVHPSDLEDDELRDPASPLARCGRSVVLELTDRSPLEDASRLRDRVASLRALGYGIAVDDVGTGSSSLNRLALVEPDFAKLNGSIVRGLDRDAGRRTLAASMTRAFHDLGIRVVASGVETVDEQAAAEEAGVDLLQGFLFGRPKPICRSGGRLQ